MYSGTHTHTLSVSACERRSERVESGVWSSSRDSTCFCTVCSSTVASSSWVDRQPSLLSQEGRYASAPYPHPTPPPTPTTHQVVLEDVAVLCLAHAIEMTDFRAQKTLK